MNDWKDYSDVVITFKNYEREGKCTMFIKHTKIDGIHDLDNLKRGWVSQIIEPLQFRAGYPREME